MNIHVHFKYFILAKSSIKCLKKDNIFFKKNIIKQNFQKQLCGSEIINGELNLTHRP